MNDIVKFANLRSCLHGEALRKVQTLNQTAGDYITAKQILKRWYGNENSIITTLRSILLHMHEWVGPSCVKKGFDFAESYIQQLTKLTGEEYNSTHPRP